MMSLLQDLARDYQSAVVDFGQVLLASGILVTIAWGLKRWLLPDRAGPSRKPRQPRAREARLGWVKPKAKGFEVPVRTVATDVSSGPTAMRPMSPETHLQRAAASLGSKIAHGERARELHDRAFVRLESVDYAFQRLLLDITPFVSLIPEPDVTHPAPPMINIPQRHTVRLAA